MKLHRLLLGAAVAVLAVACDNPQTPTAPSVAKSAIGSVGIEVALQVPVSDAIVADLGRFGLVKTVMPEISVVTLIGKASDLSAIQALPYVAEAGFDREREGSPIDLTASASFEDRPGMWNLDMVNATTFGGAIGETRDVDYDGDGVYVGVLDTGLLDAWRAYFPEERIAVQYARSFTGGGALDGGNSPEQPNKWEHDQNSHGTHVVSTILGFNRFNALGQVVARNGVAPMATIIPVKVLNQNGSGWSSAVAQGITYITSLKQGALRNSAVVINMSLGGGQSVAENRAIDNAIANGVIVVAAAGNGGPGPMHYPGAYEPVIGVANVGWTKQWQACPPAVTAARIGAWYFGCDVTESNVGAEAYVANSSGRPSATQELDIAAPGSWVVGPYQLNSATGKLTYFYLSGTSMASPHVAGVAALLLDKNKTLNQEQVTSHLKAGAWTIPPSTGMTVAVPAGTQAIRAWRAEDVGAGLVNAKQSISLVPLP